MQIRGLSRTLILLASIALLASCSSSAKKTGTICVGDNECGSDLCLAGQCIALTKCQSQSDCGGKGSCQDGHCWEVECDESRPCPYGQCTEGYCVRVSEKPDAGEKDLSSEDTSVDKNVSGEDAGCQTNEECNGKFSDLKQCEQAVCNNGTCRRLPKVSGESCDDNNGCTNKSECDGTGTCKGLEPVDCNDPSNACTADTKCISTGATTYRCTVEDNKDKPCDDKNPCSIGDTCDDKGVCQAGSGNFCVEQGNECQQGGVCTNDAGTPKCNYSQTESKVCNDANRCTNLDQCKSGVCAGTTAPLGTHCGVENGLNMICGRFADCHAFTAATYTFVPSEYSSTNTPERFQMWDLCKTSDNRVYLTSQGLVDVNVGDNLFNRYQYIGMHEVKETTIAPPTVDLNWIQSVGFELTPLESVTCQGDWLIANGGTANLLRYDATKKLWSTDGLDALKAAYNAANQYDFNINTLYALYHQAGPVETWWFGGKIDNLSQFPQVEKSRVVLRCCEMDDGDKCVKGQPMRCVFTLLAPLANTYPEFNDWTVSHIVGLGSAPWVLKSSNDKLDADAGPWTLDVPNPDKQGTWMSNLAPGCDGFSASSLCYSADGVHSINRNTAGWQDLTLVSANGKTLAALVGLMNSAVKSPPPTVENPVLLQGEARFFDGTNWNRLPQIPLQLINRQHLTASGSFDLAQASYGFMQARFTADGAYLVLLGGMVHCTDEAETEDCNLITDATIPWRYHFRATVAVYDISSAKWVGLTPITAPHSVTCCANDNCTGHSFCGGLISDFINHNRMKTQLLEDADSLSIISLHNRHNLKWTQQGQEPPHEPTLFRFDSKKP